MKDHPPGNSTDISRERSLSFAQFGLLDLLGLAFVVSLLFAIFIPILRAQSPAFQQCLLMMIIFWAVVAGVVLVALFLKRWQREVRGGRLLLQPKHDNLWREITVSIFLIVANLGIFIVLGVLLRPILIGLMELESELPNYFLGWSRLAAIVGAIAFAPLVMGLVYGLTMLWWKVSPATLEIRENGVGVGPVRFIPWNLIASYDWTDKNRGVVLTIGTSRRKRVAFIPAESKQAVQHFLDERLF